MEKITKVVVSGFVNKTTGAKIFMSQAGYLNGEPAFLVSDSELNKCELENYNIGLIRGFVAATAVIAASIAACIIGTRKANKKEKKEEK